MQEHTSTRLSSPIRRAAMRRIPIIVAVLSLALAGNVFAKMYEEPKSFSLNESLQQVDRRVVEEIDPERLEAAERERGKDPRRPQPFRFAVSEEVTFDLENSGTWERLPDGQLWRLILRAPGALSLSLGFTRFDLPEGAKLWIYDPERVRVEGPYTARHRSRKGRLWTPVIEGEEIVVELFSPAGTARPALTIGTVHKGFRDFTKDSSDKSHGPCNNDVICPEGDPWRDQIRSVARYTIGNFLCTGQLINNTAIDERPYFLSAHHCGVTSANDDTLVFYWNFEAPNCGDQNGGSLADNQTGAIFRASSAASDFLLVELAMDPDPSFDVFFTGWDATGVAAASTVGIHHPSGDVKSISFNTNAVTSTTYSSAAVDAAANHWRVDDWEDGTTEGGSSGSCLWDAATKRCVGQLHGGFASCASITDDWYGKLSVSWNGGGTDATRLRNWLDPDNTGVLVLDGDPHITTLDGTRYDFQGAGEFVVLRDPGGAEVQVRQAPIATTFTPGPDSHHGLTTCVSLNTAVAARVGEHRVTYQPNLSGVPDPSGLELRIDGELTTLGPSGIDLGGGRITSTAAPGGLQITFPSKYTLQVTPGWWNSQSKWYLNVGMARSPAPGGVPGANPGASGGTVVTGGLGGVIPRGSWLPALPDGSSMGPMPTSLHDRYVALYQKFGGAWRVSDETSLFDYASGTSTDTFTLETWPMEQPPCVLPEETPVRPLRLAVARRACRGIRNPATRANCTFDVRVTGERGFARTYQLSERTAASTTQVTMHDDRDPTKPGEPVTFVATVTRAASGVEGGAEGTVQFSVNGERAESPVRLDRGGQATWKTSRLEAGTHRVTATFIPAKGSALLPGISGDESHTVGEGYRSGDSQ